MRNRLVITLCAVVSLLAGAGLLTFWLVRSLAPAAALNYSRTDGHRKNILNGDFTKIGIGVCSSGGAMYWVQLFVG